MFDSARRLGLPGKWNRASSWTVKGTGSLLELHSPAMTTAAAHNTPVPPFACLASRQRIGIAQGIPGDFAGAVGQSETLNVQHSNRTMTARTFFTSNVGSLPSRSSSLPHQ